MIPLSLMSNPWVQKVLFPLVAHIFFKALDRYTRDPQFAKSMDDAHRQWIGATTKQEKLDATTKLQDALYR